MSLTENESSSLGIRGSQADSVPDDWMRQRPADPVGGPPRDGAAHQAARPPGTPAAPANAATAFVPTAMQHATSAKMSRCTPLIGQATQFTAAVPSATLSLWSFERPDDHMFQALIGLGAGTPEAPSSAVVVVASPEGQRCDATVVQVRPSARTCAEIEGDLRQSGANLTRLSGMAVVQGAGTAREMLVPVPGAGCVIVGTGLALNK